MKRFLIVQCVVLITNTLCAVAREPFPIDPAWNSPGFRKALTASYGFHARIEPALDREEQEALAAVATDVSAGGRAEAVKRLRNHSRLSGSAVLQFTLGNLLFEAGDTREAARGFVQALKLYPNFRDAHRNLGVLLIGNQQAARAFPYLARAVELGARDGQTLGWLGYCHSEAGRHHAALQAFRLAQLTQPHEAQWRQGEAFSLQALGEDKSAAHIYTTLLAAEPLRHDLWLGQARALQADDPARAIANLEFLRRQGALGATQLYSLGSLYLNEGLPDEALACFTSACAAQPPLATQSAVTAVEALAHGGHFPEAKALADTLVVDDDRLLRVRALCELESGKRERGVALVEALVERDPLDSQALMLLGRFRVAAGAFHEAALCFEQAARDPEYAAEALRHHGQLLVEGRDYGAALPLLQRAHALAPDAALADYIEAVRGLE